MKVKAVVIKSTALREHFRYFVVNNEDIEEDIVIIDIDDFLSYKPLYKMGTSKLYRFNLIGGICNQ